MTKAEQLLKLVELVGAATVAHENVVASTSGSQQKIQAIGERSLALDALEQFADSVEDDGVADRAYGSHTALAKVISNDAISDILGAANILDGFAQAFNNAADGAEKVQVLTDKWATIAETAARNVTTVLEQTKQAAKAVHDQLKAIRDELAAV
jgi:hypothetical protein